MSIIREFINAFSNKNHIPPEEFENLAYKLSEYFLKYFPSFEMILVNSSNGLVGNIYYDSSNEECQKNYDGYLDDCALFLSTLREGGEILIFVDQPSGEIDLYAFIPDTKTHSISACTSEFLETSKDRIIEIYGISPDQKLNFRELDVEQILRA